jgi:hypothetical protein
LTEKIRVATPFISLKSIVKNNLPSAVFRQKPEHLDILIFYIERIKNYEAGSQVVCSLADRNRILWTLF